MTTGQLGGAKAPRRRRAPMAGFILLIGTLAPATFAAAGEAGVIAADAAARRAAAGEILVIDVRSPG